MLVYSIYCLPKESNAWFRTLILSFNIFLQNLYVNFIHLIVLKSWVKNKMEKFSIFWPVMGIGRRKEVTQCCFVFFLIRHSFLRNLRESCWILCDLFDVNFSQFFIQLNDRSKSNIFFILVLQYFFYPKVVVGIFFFDRWYKCVLSHFKNIDGFFLFHLQINFCHETMCVFLFFDHPAIFEKILTISQVIGLEFDTLFLCRSFG